MFLVMFLKLSINYEFSSRCILNKINSETHRNARDCFAPLPKESRYYANACPIAI